MLEKKYIAKLPIFLIILLMVSCSKELQENSLYDINEEFFVSIGQDVNETGPFLTLKLESILPEPCSNTELLTEVVESSTEFLINLISFQTIGPCVSEPTIVRKNIPLPQFSSTLPINLRLKGVVNNFGTLRSTNSLVNLEFTNVNGIEVKKSKIYLIPDNTVWGEIKLDQAKLATIIQVLDELSKTSILQLKSGDYGLFNLQSSGVQLLNPIFTAEGISFAMRYDDWDTWKEQMTNILVNNGITTYQIRNWKDQSL